MAVALRAVTTPVKSSANSVISLTVNKPTGTQADDLMLAFISVSSAQTMTTVPTGWNLLPGFPAVDSGSGIYSNLWVYYRYAKPSEPSAYTWGWANNGGGIITILAYSGAQIAAGKYATGVRPSTTTTSTTSSITTTGSAWIITAFADASGSTWTLGDTSRAADTRTSAASLAVQDTNGPVAAGTYSRTATATVSIPVATTAIVAIEAGGPPPDAGPDQTGVKPFATVTLSATGTGSWSQTGGTPSGIPLGGSGATRTFTAPATQAGTTLTFSYGGDTMTVTVLSHNEWSYDGSVWTPFQWVDL